MNCCFCRSRYRRRDARWRYEAYRDHDRCGNGVVDNVDVWGKRKLAYEINGLTDGDYTLIDFHADPQNIAELDRVLRITDAVVRHMIVARTDRD